jgi:hypothetical protein
VRSRPAAHLLAGDRCLVCGEENHDAHDAQPHAFLSPDPFTVFLEAARESEAIPSVTAAPRHCGRHYSCIGTAVGLQAGRHLSHEPFYTPVAFRHNRATPTRRNHLTGCGLVSRLTPRPTTTTTATPTGLCQR